MKLPLGQEWSNTQARYVAYCLEHNAACPDDMLAFDRERYPGGCMAGYIVWNSRKWRRWAEEYGVDVDASRTREDHESFDIWLLTETFAEWLLLEREPSPSLSGETCRTTNGRG